MISKVFVGCLLYTLCFFANSLGQNSSGIIDSNRSIDWSQVGVAGGIPSRSAICSTLNPGATAAQINAAIAACPSGQVVYLNAGTYPLSAGIDFANHSGVTLRGAGANATFLVFSGGINCSGASADVCIRNAVISYADAPSHAVSWTAGYAKGTKQVTLSSTANLVAGKSVLILDQLDDASDTGNVFICQTVNQCADEGSGGAGRPGRAQEQFALVTGISGNTVTISPGLYMPNWRSSQNPGAWFSNTIISGSGVENLSLDHTVSAPTSGIMMFNAYNCWVKGIRSITPSRNHVWFNLAAGSVVRDSYFYGTQNAASESYGVEAFQSGDNLIENNIFQHISNPMILNGAASGSVFGYNFSIDDHYVSPLWMQPGNQMHAAGTDMILFEGNEGNGLMNDIVHGTHNFITAFRNQYIGWEPGKIAITNPIDFYAGSRYMNVIGNVLGKAGYHTQYQSIPPNGISSDFSIYSLGWSGNEGGTNAHIPNDLLVASTLMRWGNYDTVSGSAQWNSSEVPSGISPYGNALPGSHNLPASFYLAAQPSWWRTMPWPAIGPDVSGGSDSSGHAYANSAQICYNNSPRNGEILNFDAVSCYSGSGDTTPLVPPANLRGVVQ